MHSLKQDTTNKARPEGSICEAYLDMEVVNFCAWYFAEEAETQDNLTLRRNQVRQTPYAGAMVFRSTGKPFGPKMLVRDLTHNEYVQAYLYILYNCDEVDPFQDEFENLFCQGMDHIEMREYKLNNFIPWFRGAVLRAGYDEESLLADLASGPSGRVRQYKGYMVNGFRFHTHSYGASKGTSNSGVWLKGTTELSDGVSDFYGVLHDIVTLDFGNASVVLFKCRWYDTATTDGVWKNDAYGLVEINPRRKYPLDEPFVLADQVQQVYYTNIPGKRRGMRRRNWLAVFHTRSRHVTEGFTNDQAQEDEQTSSDEDNDQVPNVRGIVFQDPDVPRMVLRSGREIARITRSTGRMVELTERVDFDVAPAPPNEEAFNFDAGVEEHSSDSDA